MGRNRQIRPCCCGADEPGLCDSALLTSLSSINTKIGKAEQIVDVHSQEQAGCPWLMLVHFQCNHLARILLDHWRWLSF